MRGPLLCLVEDDFVMGESLCDRFRLEGFEVEWHRSAGNALGKFEERDYALVLSDVKLPDMTGEHMFHTLRSRYSVLPPVLFITGYGSIDKAVTLLKLGAADYITKPFDIESLVDKVKALAMQPSVKMRISDEEPRLGISSAMRHIEATLRHLAGDGSDLLVTGESGVGKEAVVRFYHEVCHDGTDAPFIAVNCGGIAESLLEAELFGHEKGAFTGATRTRKGVFEQADGGTLLLDEIGEMPLNMQVNLLRVIQERCVTRVGGERSIPVRLQIVCATHRDLKQMVRDGSFREDLYYRINVIHLHIPALRDRQEDILWFAQRFIDDFRTTHPETGKTLDHSADRALVEHPWDGNLRELRNCIERACVLSGQDRLTPSTLFLDSPVNRHGVLDATPNHPECLRDYVRQCERDFIVDALARNSWHILETAQTLGISRKNLWEKMKKLDIHPPPESS